VYETVKKKKSKIVAGQIGHLFTFSALNPGEKKNVKIPLHLAPGLISERDNKRKSTTLI
jgi:hypothetical protein